MKIMAIIRNELWQRRRGLLFWAIGVVALISIDMLLYKEIKADSKQLSDVYSSLSSTVRSLFSDTGDFLSPAGYLSGRVYYLLLPLLLTIFTVGLGSNLIGKEEQQGTLELLLARPVSRLKLLSSKTMAGLAAVGVLFIAAVITALACYKAVGFEGVTVTGIILATLEAFVLSTLFGAIALCCSCLGGVWRSLGTPLAILVAFGSYLLASLENVAKWLSWPAKLLPYHYYNPSDVLTGHSHALIPMASYAGLSVIFFIIAWLGFRRRDLG
jgi:ABC-2 type transport system permease protein